MKSYIKITIFVLAIISFSLNIAAQSIIYSEKFTAGIGYCPGEPQYDNWGAFRNQLDTNTFFFTSVTIKGDFDPVGLTCTDLIMVKQMAGSLKDGIPGDWVFGVDSFHVGITCFIGCALPGDAVEFTVTGADCNCIDPGYTVRPCIGNESWGGINGPTCLAASQIMTVEFTYVVYCNPTYTNPCSSLDFIDGVVISDLSNLSTGCNGNADNFIFYNSMAANVALGLTYPITLTPSTSSAQGFGVWMDFNGNGDFADAGDFVLSVPAGIVPVTNSITIPMSASLGDTRMRVRSIVGATPVAGDFCNNQTSGETEDYVLSIKEYATDVGVIAITAPAPCGILSSTETVTITIENFGVDTQDTIPVSYTMNGSPAIKDTLFATLASGSTASYSFVSTQDMSALGSYIFNAWTELVGDGDISNDSVNGYTSEHKQICCIPAFQNDCSSDDYIDGVVFAGVNNNSTGCNGNPDNFIYYANDTAIVSTSNSFNITLTPSSVFNQGFGVWIDYNIDGDFDDAGEFVYSSPPTLVPVVGSINIPGTALMGNSIMRVRCIYGTTPIASNNCDDQTFGETEDYNIKIRPPASIDAGITLISSPVSGCGLQSNELVTVDVLNYGLDTIFGLDVYYAINGGTPVMESISDTIPPSSFITHTFSVNADLSGLGTYLFKSWTDLNNDTVYMNDTLFNYQVLNDGVIIACPSLTTLTDDFEGEALCGTGLFACNPDGACSLSGNWQNANGDDIDWSINQGPTPSGNTGPQVDNTTSTASGKYIYAETSSCNGMEVILESPCINLAFMNSPYISFYYHMFGTNMGDLYLEVDTGVGYTALFSLSGQQQTLQTNPWLEADVDLSAYSTGIVKLRFRGLTGTGFMSDMALDDIRIYDSISQPADVGVIDIISPNSGYVLGCSEILSVKVKNFGTVSQDTIPIAFSVNGNPAIRDTIYENLDPNNELDFSFLTPLDLSQVGSYNISSWTELPGDLVQCNDSIVDYLVVSDSNIVLGTGVNANDTLNYPAPYGNSNTCSRHQMMIRASELAGFSAGNINSLGFNVKSANGAILKDFEIKMKLTSDLSVTSNFDNSGFTTVWGAQDFSEIDGWNMHVFGTPFYWDGLSNILIETCFCNGISNSSNNAEMFYTNTSFPSTIFQYTDIDSNHCLNSSLGFTAYSRPDIRLDLQQNLPPNASFGANFLLGCPGESIQFSDSSLNFPTCWYWDFGDGASDSVQNPIHTYVDTGYFTVTLVAYNIYGADTAIYTNFIEIKVGASIASCQPVVTNSSNDIGIYSVQFNGINNTTGSLVQEYHDYSCSYFTTILIGSKHTFSIETGPSWNENVRVWIDFDNNTIFNDTTELVMSSDDKLQYHSLEYIFKQNAVTDTMLRMRVSSDYTGGPSPLSCSNIEFGQCEDYGVYFETSTNKPEADYNFSFIDPCNGIIQFTDFSSFFPDSLYWDFGDGNTAVGDTVTNTYTPGLYQVTLIATNSYGSDTTTQTVFVDSVYAQFSFPSDSVNPGVVVSYTNTSYGANNWSWDFGDSGTSSIQNPLHAYDSAGTYTIWLLVTNTATGCMDSISQQIVVFDPPPPDTTIGVEYLAKDFVIDINPIPSGGILNVDFETDDVRELSISICDITGKDIYYKDLFVRKIHSEIIDLTLESKGVYFVKISDRNGLLRVRKIVLE